MLKIIRACIFIILISSYGYANNFIYEINNRLQVLLKKANNFEEQNDLDNAITIYNEALKIVSENRLVTDASYIYKKIGLIYYKQKDYKNSKTYFKKSVLKDSNSKNAADSYFNLCLIYRKEKVKDSLYWALNKTLEIYKTLSDGADKYSTYSKAGIIYKQSGQYDKAIKYLLLAYEGLDDKTDTSRKASVCYTIGETQRLLGNFDIAKTYLFESLRLRKTLNDTLKTSYAYNNLGNLYKDVKQYDSATVYYKNAIDIQKNLNKQKERGKMLNNLASTYFLTENFDLSLETYKKALGIKRQEKDSLSMPYTFNELALISIKKKNSNVARRYLDSAKHYLSTISKKEAWLRYYEIESKYHLGINEYKKAYEYQTLQFNLYKELFSEEQTKTIQTLQEQFESRLKEQQISELMVDNHQKTTTISFQKQRLKNRDLMLAVLCLLVLFFIGVYFYLKQRQKIKIQDLENQKLKEVLEGQEIIKDHISKDLHDMIPTSYDAIRLKILALAKAKEPGKVIKSIIEDIKTVNHDIRLISHRLSPLGEKIKDTSLTEIIVSHFSEFQHYRKIFIDVQLPLPKQMNSMTLNVQTHIYGIILEILNNVEKHSKATKISIQHALTNNNQMTLKFCDDGIGIQNQKSEGIGLTNIKQRTLLLGGLFKIESNTEGTCIELTIPITSNLK